ncbi:MAG: AAA family ATPase [Phycisphaerae bacterium]|nr:AAA family ATPase [Phycisphaerae bacterium]
MIEASLTEELRRPGALPEGSGPVEACIETHASIVLLTAERAWKLKKRVNLGFLDFTSVEARHRDCENEVRLNRRMVPDMYLGVWPIVTDDAGTRLVRTASSGATVIDWAVEMRRLPADGMLDRVLASGGPRVELVERFAEDLAAFHAGAATGLGVDEHGAIHRVERRVRDNLERLALHAPLDAEFTRRLRCATLAWLSRIAETLEARCSHGRVREGHGDLHARNLCVVDDRIVAYDCLEFSAAYRCSDVASDVGFLAMDFDARGRRDLAEHFIARYEAASGDHGVRHVERFFRMHYAIIRAMVDSIRLADPTLPEVERAPIRVMVRDYATLAAGYAVEPALVIMTGLPATGKSTIARSIAKPLRAEIVRTDEIRKRLTGLDPTERGDASLYRDEHTRRTYAAAVVAASERLAQRQSVVIDAANLFRWQRELFTSLGHAQHIRVVVVETTADASMIRHRLTGRASDRAEVSDATWQIYELKRAEREPLDDVGAEALLTVDVSQSPEEATLDVLTRMLPS